MKGRGTMSASCSIGSNNAVVNVGNLTLWFSYRTLIAFQVGGQHPIVIQNYWGPTTGKHLNAVDHGDKSGRLNEKAFKLAFAEVLKSHNL
jgi:hypothetical protein